MEPYYADDAVTLYHGDWMDLREYPQADLIVGAVRMDDERG